MEIVITQPVTASDLDHRPFPIWKPLNSMEFEPTQQVIIEASAGTGKTFALVWIYLRLLLGLQNQQAKPRLPSEILVITFTVAATMELQKRIKQALLQLKHFLDAPDPTLRDDPAILAIWNRLTQLPQRKPWVALCLDMFDDAAICTLHSFCGQVLKRWAFETGELPPPAQLSQSSEAFESGCSVYWHQQVSSTDKRWSLGFLKHFATPKSLSQHLRRLLTQFDQPVSDVGDLKILFLEEYGCYESACRSLSGHLGLAPLENWSQTLGMGSNRPKLETKKWLSWFQSLLEAGKIEHSLQFGWIAFDQNPRPDWESLPVGILAQSPDAQNFFQQLRQAKDAWLRADGFFLAHAWQFCHSVLLPELWEMGIGGFDDLVRQTRNALTRFPILAKKLQNAYPYALVDEFQDTDAGQYEILRHIYPKDYPGALILIGDPKQAIYGFRGAKLKTYFLAVQESQQHYRLSVNWRASREMVAANNQIWSNHSNPFGYKLLPFVRTIAGMQSLQAGFFHRGLRVPAIQFEVLQNPDHQVVWQRYYLTGMAKYCAECVKQWLDPEAQAETFLIYRGQTRPLHPSDIAILVRSGQEADLLKAAFSQQGLETSYPSQTKPLFQSIEANTILNVLQAIWWGEDQKAIVFALTEPFFGFSESELDQYVRPALPQQDITNFLIFKKTWQMEGIYALFRQLIHCYSLRARWSGPGLTGAINEIILYQIIEKLVSIETKGADPLGTLSWLEKQTSSIEADDGEYRNPLRLGNEAFRGINLTTIHKAKGLEYPIVWIPFAGRVLRRGRNNIGYTSGSTRDLAQTADAEHGKEAVDCAFAEETRLLYVAMTRASLHCRIGMAGIRERQTQSTARTTDVHRSSIGRLIQGEFPKTVAELHTAIRMLCGQDIHAQFHDGEALCPDRSISMPGVGDPPRILSEPVRPSAETVEPDVQTLREPLTHRRLDKVGSYSAIMQQNASENFMSSARLSTTTTCELEPRVCAGPLIDFFEDPLKTRPQAPVNPRASLIDFPKGANAGSFLHQLLETLPFESTIALDRFEEALSSSAFSTDWAGPLRYWWAELMRYPWTADGPSFEALVKRPVFREFPFTFHISKRFSVEKLDLQLSPFVPLEYHSGLPKLTESGWQGFLKGFIDLVFFWKGRYYIGDYKSNWLGTNRQDYMRPSLWRCVAAHRYDLQYALYSLAMHRYLKITLPDYEYDKDFGGIFYLFLRGACMPLTDGDGCTDSPGTFFYRLPKSFILSMDGLLSASPDNK